MIEVVLFAEDLGHEVFLKALLERLARERAIAVRIRVRSATGGYGRALQQLREFVRDVERDRERRPDLLLVGVDANCQGFVEKRRQIEGRLGALQHIAVYAIPNPHLERWLLLDPAGFASVLGGACSLPDQKCDKDRYKQLLLRAVRDTGTEPLIGGLEFAQDLAARMDLDRARKNDDAFHRFLQELLAALNKLVGD
jgi:hypothetical protein